MLKAFQTPYLKPWNFSFFWANKDLTTLSSTRKSLFFSQNVHSFKLLFFVQFIQSHLESKGVLSTEISTMSLVLVRFKREPYTFSFNAALKLGHWAPAILVDYNLSRCRCSQKGSWHWSGMVVVLDVFELEEKLEFPSYLTLVLVPHWIGDGRYHSIYESTPRGGWIGVRLI